MAKKTKTEDTKIDADVVDAQEVSTDITEDMPEADADPLPQEDVVDAVAEEEVPEEEHLEENRTSLAARVLQGLFLIFIGVALALWGAPRLAPLLPAGLAPVAEFLTPGQTEAKAEVASLRADMQQQLNALSAKTAGSADKDAILKAVSDATASLKSEIQADLADVKDRVAATDGQEVEARIAALESRFEGVSAELAAVSERLALQITENGAALSEEAAVKLSGYQAVLEGLKAQIADLAAKNGALSQKVDDVASAAARRVTEAEQDASRQVATTATKKLLTDISAALDSGAPFQSALTSLQELGDVEIPADLSAVAENGTPSWTSLRNSFSDAAHSALRADAKANAGEGISGKLGAFFKTQVGTRSLERTEGPETDAILSRVEDDLVNRRLDAALAEANSLPEAPQIEMSNWINDLRALAAAQSSLGDLKSSLGAS